jgi:hypothetical protein
MIPVVPKLLLKLIVATEPSTAPKIINFSHEFPKLLFSVQSKWSLFHFQLIHDHGRTSHQVLGMLSGSPGEAAHAAAECAGFPEICGVSRWMCRLPMACMVFVNPAIRQPSGDG